MTAEQAFDEHHRSVYRFVYRLVGRSDVAEDITQDCFLAMLRNPAGWDPNRGEIRTYLFSIARNLAFKRYRGERSNDELDDEVVSIGDHELSLTIAQLVGQLPELQREALILFEYEGFQLSEIARIVSADIGVVKSRLHRARERLKRLLAPCRKVGTHGSVC